MPRSLLALVLLTACTVEPAIDDKPCPCAPGFTCVAGRCVTGAGAMDAGGGDSGGPGLPDASIDAPDGVDSGPPPAGTFEVDFAEGEHMGTRVDSAGGLVLDGVGQGTYRSRVFDANLVTLMRLLWDPEAPYAKPLPREGASETGYVEGAMAMDDNVVLYDFDNAAASPGRMVLDRSGRGNVGEVMGRLDATPVAAPVGFGYHLGTETWLTTPLTSTSDLQLGSSDWTWMAWARSTQDAESGTGNNRVFFGMEQGGGSPHIWFGLRTACNGAADGATMGGTLRSSSGDDQTSYCGGSVANRAGWHLVAMTKAGQGSGTVRVWFDGQADGSQSVSFNGPFDFTTDESMTYGAFRRGTFPTDVEMAQIATFRRALNAAQIRAAHRRAALRLSVQVRLCSLDDCSDDSTFFGPDATAQSFFRDPVENLSPPVEHEVELGGDYLQIEVRLESDISGETPRLRSMSLTP